MAHVIKLARQHDVFYCPVNRVHLYYYNPTGMINVLSDAVIKALESKKIVDVNGTIELPKEESEEKSPAQEMAEKIIEGVKASEETPAEDQEGVDLEDLNKDALLSFIKENGMTMKELGVTSKSSEEKLRDAIWAHLEKESESNAKEN